MKINWNSKYNTISVYSLIVICCSIIFYFVASQIGSFSEKISIAIGIMYPFIIGFAIAYLLNFILNFYEVNIFGKAEWFNKLRKGQKRYWIIINILNSCIYRLPIYTFYSTSINRQYNGAC